MASFWRGSRESRGHDALLKQTLTDNLSECVKVIQFNHQTEEGRHQTLGSNELTNGLCAALEAIFIHGLKDNFFKKAKIAFKNDSEQKPQPNFWPILLVLSHRDNIQQISSLQQITTDIGQSRAWIRIALNDGLLSSYLSTMIRDLSVSKLYYSPAAYVRDSELLDVAQRLIEGVESCINFRIPINSSLLNAWPEDVLLLAGVWTPTMRSIPIASAVDVASTLVDTEPNNRKISYIPGREYDSTGLGHVLGMDQDKAMDYILSNTPENFMDNMPKSNEISIDPGSSGVEPNQSIDEPITEENKDADDKTEIIDDSEIRIEYNEPSSMPDLNSIGNSIVGKSTWSSDDFKDTKSGCESKNVTPSVDEESSDNTFVKTPNLRDVVNDLRIELKLNCDDNESISQIEVTTPTSPDDPLLEGLGFEVISKSPSNYFTTEELQNMIDQIGRLSREYGLDSQDYQCLNCNDTLGATISKAKVCAYTGNYFCSTCMDPNVFMIPARVIHNWDFYRYPVSKRAATFLLEFQHQPLINMKKINPLIYTGVEQMAQLQVLRIQLNFLRAYLFTCREPIIEDLQKRIWPREYLYEHVHIYSVSDLAQISNGSLASQLHKIVVFARSHVKDCWLCSQKGFICEVCHIPKILYPFDIETTYRCESCSSVFHSKCLNALKPCPKCERIRKRQGKSLVDAVHTNFQ